MIRFVFKKDAEENVGIIVPLILMGHIPRPLLDAMDST
jgi:hypothetical protein